jgi:hypothetical protein
MKLSAKKREEALLVIGRDLLKVIAAEQKCTFDHRLLAEAACGRAVDRVIHYLDLNPSDAVALVFFGVAQLFGLYPGHIVTFFNNNLFLGRYSGVLPRWVNGKEKHSSSSRTMRLVHKLDAWFCILKDEKPKPKLLKKGNACFPEGRLLQQALRRNNNDDLPPGA